MESRDDEADKSSADFSVSSPRSLRARLERVIRPRVQGTGCPRLLVPAIA